MALAGLSKSEKDEHCVCFAALALHDGGAEINADSIKAMVEACVEIKILRRVRAELPRRLPRHRRDACSMAWRCRFLAARPSQDSRAIAVR